MAFVLENQAKLYLNMFDAKPGLFILSIDVLWLKYLFFTSFRLSVYSLQRVDCNESDARFTITYTVYTNDVNDSYMGMINVY